MTVRGGRGAAARRLGSIAAATALACLAAIGIEGPASAAVVLPVAWEAGGLSAGTGSAGQGEWVAADAAGNVAVTSGAVATRALVTTSYTAAGTLRWRRSILPASGFFAGSRAVTAANGDVVVAATDVASSGSTIVAAVLVRYSSTGALRWRVDLPGGLGHAPVRLVLDAAGNAYFAWSFEAAVRKYSPAGALLWESKALVGATTSSLALSPDGSQVVTTATTAANWVVVARDAATGAVQWVSNVRTGPAARDVVVDGTRVYVAGMGASGVSTFLAVAAYDRASGARVWRRDVRPADATGAAGLWLDRAPDGSLVVAGTATRGFLDWYTVALSRAGVVRWTAVRDGRLPGDEVPAGVDVLRDGTAVVTGVGGPALAGGFLQGVTAGYSPTGTLVWEGFSRFAQLWVTGTPAGDVCTTGGYDAYVSCFDVP